MPIYPHLFKYLECSRSYC